MSFQIRVWGPRARFTAPHTRAEPYTEDVMTPSAAKRLLLAIYGKPEFEWVVEAIHVMRPIRKENLILKGPKGLRDTTLQTATDLIDVEYVIVARIEINRERTADRAKYIGEVRRRLATGERYQPLYLGVREYEAYYELLANAAEIQPIAESRDLGSILYANVPLDFDADHYEPVFFRGRLDRGTLHVPEALHAAYLPTIMARVAERAARKGAA